MKKVLCHPHKGYWLPEVRNESEVSGKAEEHPNAEETMFEAEVPQLLPGEMVAK